MSTQSSAAIARGLLAVVAAGLPEATPAERLEAARRLWEEGCDGLGDDLERATVEARAAERARENIQLARVAWVEAWPIVAGGTATREAA